MKPSRRFLNQPKHFWANVRLISEQTGYTVRATGEVRVPTPADIRNALQTLDLDCAQIVGPKREPTPLGKTLSGYFRYRARVLNQYVKPGLMDVQQARQTFGELRRRLRATKCPIPMNKQKGEKKAPAYLTGIVNMLIEANAQGLPCDHDPRRLTTVTRNGAALRTLARRVDGAFPGTVNPIAVWEIKEYYYTTTFGSRVADGIYESLLDGMELEDLREHEGVAVKHYLMLDGRYTWWECGRSYLCRVVDMLHMGYVDEVLFGREVIAELPRIVTQWVRLVQARARLTPRSRLPGSEAQE
jgi:hypothetical protein